MIEVVGDLLEVDVGFAHHDWHHAALEVVDLQLHQLVVIWIWNNMFLCIFPALARRVPRKIIKFYDHLIHTHLQIKLTTEGHPLLEENSTLPNYKITIIH